MVVLDSWGLPLLRPVLKVLDHELDAWKIDRTDFGLVEPETTTDNYYRQLLSGDIRHTFEKCNVIDQILHERDLKFQDLLRIVEAELIIALQRTIPRLDPARDFLVFADHGFRLDASGHRFQHGGASTLERVVPVCRLVSRERLTLNGNAG
jgi:hypothetical protein